MSSLTPKISIVMAVYNAERYLNEAINSILNQTLKDFEFIIINDGSTDDSLRTIKSYKDERIVVLNQENSGNAIARNRAIQKTRSSYIAILDADDIALPRRLAIQYKFLSNNPEYVIVGSNAELIDINNSFVCNSILPLTNEKIKGMLPEMPFIHPSVMFRKGSFYKAGQYPEYMIKGEDRVLINRMANLGKFANISENLIQYRIVPTSNSARGHKNSKTFNKILLKAIKYNKISDEDCIYLKKQNSNRNSKKRFSNYHRFLAMKYLWNNYQLRLARKNLISALKLNPFSLLVYFLIVFSFLPEKIILTIYSSFKKRF